MPSSLRRTAITSIPWDLTWLFGGVFLGVAWLASQLWVPALRLAPDDSLLIALTAAAVLLGTVHRWGSTVTALGSPLFEEARRRRTLRFFWGPRAVVAMAVILGMLAGFSTEPDLGPGSRRFLTGAFSVALNVYFWWEIWHFTAQHFGVLSLYRIRSGQRGAWDRRMDRGYAMFAILVCLPLFRLAGLDYAGTSHRAFFLAGTPLEAIQPALAMIAPVTALLLGSLALFAMGRELLRRDRCPWKIGIYAKIGAAPALMYAAGDPGDLAILGFYFVYTVDHWLVAVGLVGRINLNYERELQSAGGSRWRGSAAPLVATLRRLGPIVLLAWLLQIALPSFNLFAAAEPYQVALSLNESAGALVRGIVLGWFLAINFLHYYCDWLLFSFKYPETRSAIAPLLFPTPGRSPSPQVAATS